MRKRAATTRKKDSKESTKKNIQLIDIIISINCISTIVEKDLMFVFESARTAVNTSLLNRTIQYWTKHQHCKKNCFSMKKKGKSNKILEKHN